MLKHPEHQYLDLLNKVLTNGEKREDRTGTGTLALFDMNMRFDLSKGFPLFTTKKVHFKSIVHELIWMLSGNTNIQYLKDNGVRIWNEWSDKDGNLGPVYGKQWRQTTPVDYTHSIDQIAEVIESIKTTPHSRRHLISAWNVSQLSEMALPPCHYAFQFYVSNDNKLSLKFNMRSSDMFLGLPFNIAQYALLCHMVAQVTGLEVGYLSWSGGDCHIYLDHIEQVKKQIQRDPLPFPELRLNKNITCIDDFKYEDIELVNYQSHGVLKGKVSV